jgi:predicted ribosome quality control (RQC) complex YloA/Tae2 family protein
MALDGIFLYSIIAELKDIIINSRVDKINQPEKDELALTLRTFKGNKKLLISASSNYPRIHFTNTSKPNPIKAPMFCMVLRKYLSNSKIIDITQKDTDRIVTLKFESNDDLGFNSIYLLVIEIMGRHSNITLIRERDNVIMDSIKHITSDINSFRNLYPGITYVASPESHKLNPLNFNYDEYLNCLEDRRELKENIFSSLFTGVSSILSKELINILSIDDYSLLKNESTYSFIKDYFEKIFNKNFYFSAFGVNKDNLKDFYCLKLKTTENLDSIVYDSPSILLEDFYSRKDKADRINSKSSDLQKLLHTNIDRCNKKIKILNDTLTKCSDKDRLKSYGELLYSMKKGMKEINLLNFYSETEEYLNIQLDINKTPSENIQSYFKKYAKLKSSEEAAIKQKELCDEELEYLNSVLTNILNCDSYDEINEIRKELVESGYIKFKRSSKTKDKPLKPTHFISSDGIDIYVGKNNMQNDDLTLKFADKFDTWLHTKDIPGSHVIIKATEIPDKTLEEAAILASFYSKARESSKVAVDYTIVKNVKKPSGAKPGMVIYYTNKTIYVTPKELNLQKK